MQRTSALLFSLFLATSAFSQMQMPKPGPEHKQLDYFAGNWTCDGDSKPGPMGPGGKITMTQRSTWMDGGYFVVTQSTYKSPMGSGSGASYLGYDAGEKHYTYDEFNSEGETVHSKGVRDGDTWTWTSDMKMGPQTGQARFTEKILSPTSYSFAFDLSSDGSKWDHVLDGKCSKK